MMIRSPGEDTGQACAPDAVGRLMGRHKTSSLVIRLPTLIVSWIVAANVTTAIAAEYIDAEKTAQESLETRGGVIDKTFEPREDKPSEFFGELEDHLRFDFRTFDYRNRNPDDSKNEAWAAGGQLAIETGKWHDWIGLKVSLFTSQKLRAPDSKGGTGVLQPDQNSITVFGEAYVDLSFGAFDGRMYRQGMDLPYINRDDNRMLPNTHEAFLIGRRGTGRDFTLGHITRMKQKDADNFSPLSDVAGVNNKERGVSIAGIGWQLSPEWHLGGVIEYGWDLFNTSYAEIGWDRRNDDGWRVSAGLQFSDQRSVGDELLGDYDASAWGLQANVGRGDINLKATASSYDDSATIGRPFGGTPNFSAMVIEKFDDAGQESVGLHLTAKLAGIGLPSWSGKIAAVHGWDAVDPSTGESLPDQTEYDLGVDYKPATGFLSGLWFRLQYVYIDFDDGYRHSSRLIVNYPIPSSRSGD
jgi:hypothetical protein